MFLPSDDSNFFFFTHFSLYKFSDDYVCNYLNLIMYNITILLYVRETNNLMNTTEYLL